MEQLLRGCLYPVLLGSNTQCHTCVRHLQRYGADITVLSDKRALTLRFLRNVRLVDAGPLLSDEILLALLLDIAAESGLSLPLLVLCDPRYDGFVARNRSALESHFILRHADQLIGEGEML